MPLPPVTPPSPPGQQYSGLSLIKGAMRALGVLGQGDRLENAEAQDAIELLNQMVDLWSAEELMVPTVPRMKFDLIPGQTNYSYGPGGDFDYPRSARIEAAGIIVNSIERPLHMLTEQEWRRLSSKVSTAEFPSMLYDRGVFSGEFQSPGYFRTLTFLPIPTAACVATLYGWQPLSSFPDLTTEMRFPPAYAEALRYNLALRLAPEYQVDPPEAVVKLAISAKTKIKSLNQKPLEARCDDMFLGDDYFLDITSGNIWNP